MSLGEIAREGIRYRTLEALRDRLADQIDEGPNPKELAALSMRLERVLAELDALEAPVDSDLDDELERKRQERLARSSTAGS